jgi:hypothetical protein
MSDKLEFTIDEKTLQKMLLLKKEMGFGEVGWDDWFSNILTIIQSQKPNQSEIEKVMEKMYYDRLYENWVTNFALNLEHIWNESSAKDLDPSNNLEYEKEDNSAIVIGSGPSVKKLKHLELLANSGYNGTIICCDSALRNALNAGVTPDKFPKFYVATIDTDEIIRRYYDDPVVDRYGKKIKGIFSTVVNPLVTERARKAGIKVHWLHSLFDYNEGKKSFNQISALMVRAKKHKGLPAIQTGGNVGTSSWFVAWQILKCGIVGLIGINHSWDDDTSLDDIISHGSGLYHMEMDQNNPAFGKLFPKIYNPEFNCHCVLDPYFQYYSSALKDFISRSPSWVTTINATEGGCIFGKRISCMRFAEFLQKYDK